MLDWYDGLVGYDASGLDTGKVLVLSPGGELMQITDRWARAVGSYEEHIQIKPHVALIDMTEAARKYNLICFPVCYRIQGNPSKYLQGHNVFGPPVRSLGPIVQEVVRRLPAEFSSLSSDDNRWPAVHRTRVDVTTSIRMDNHAEVHEWIEQAKAETRSRHRKRQVQSGLIGATTVSWGLGSKRWMIKAYCKACELKEHPPLRQEMFKDLAEYAEGLLRIELELHRKELKDRGTLDESLIWEFFDRIEVGVMKDDIEKEIQKLSPRVRQIYLLWRDGHDVSTAAGFYKRASFYNYRKQILKATGEDISLPPRKKRGSIKRNQFSSEYLQEHEVKNENIPEHLQKHLYQPPESPIWKAH